MMGRTHAVSGTLVFGGVTLVHVFPIPELIAGVVITTAAALLPDIDHHKSTITKTYGPITKIVHWLVGMVFGPHRHGTHSILFVALVGFGTQLAVEHREHLAAKISLVIVLSIVTGGLIRLFKIKGWLDDILPIPIFVGVIFFTDLDLSIVPPALMLGTAAHIMGDCLTDHGCPLFWPLKGKFGINLFTTNGKGEAFAMIVFIAGIIAVIATHVGRYIS